MSRDPRYTSREEEDYYYNQRSQPQGGSHGYYDNAQGNPYASYSQPQPSPVNSRNGSYRGQEVVRDRTRERYYSEDDDDYSDDSRHRRKSRSSRSRSKKRDKSRNKEEQPSKLDEVKKHFGASDQNYMASVLGMVAGGFLGGEAVKGDRAPLGIIGGALLGGLSANAIEKKREQVKEQKEEEEARHRRRKSER